MIIPLSCRIGSSLYSITKFQIMSLDNGQSVCFAVRNCIRYIKIDFHRSDKRSRETTYREYISVRFLLYTHSRTDAIGLFFSIAYLREQFTLENSFSISIWIYLSCCAYLLEARIKTVFSLSLTSVISGRPGCFNFFRIEASAKRLCFAISKSPVLCFLIAFTAHSLSVFSSAAR